MEKLAEPLLGKYLIQNRAANLLVKGVDAALALCLSYSKRNAKIFHPPRRILLANSAHLGDVLILTSILPVLKECFPDTKIGLLIGSWSLPIVKDLPMVEWIHTVDHWKLNRADISIWRKLRRYWYTRNIALKEIKGVGYDVTVDLYYHFPNFIPLLWQARIPIRIGYTSGGFGSLLTHPQEWLNLDQHVSKYHADILQILPIDKTSFQELHYCLPSDDSDFDEAPLKMASIDTSCYIAIHMGTGEMRREWPLSKWRSLSEALSENGYGLVFTGYGQREVENARIVTEGLSKCVNLCGELSWDGFVSAVRKASLVICVESLAGHIAAAVDTDCVAIWSGMTNNHHWRPLSKLSRVLSNPVPCAPCYRSRGCATMACVHDLQSSEVYLAALEKLTKNK